MQLAEILLMAVLFILLRLFPQGSVKRWGLSVLSVFFLFHLQPALPLRGFSFWLPLSTLFLTLLSYEFVRSKTSENSTDNAENLRQFAVIAGSVVLLAATRFLSYEGMLTAERPPQFFLVLLLSGTAALLIWLASRVPTSRRKSICIAAIISLIGLLFCLKTPFLARQLSRLARMSVGQDAGNASAADLRWMGFSYIAFRLLSTLIDARKGRKICVGCGEYLSYVCFPSSLSAGPIDRLERFDRDYTALSSDPVRRNIDWQTAALRISSGLFKKFILADSLALIALSAPNSTQFTGRVYAWAALFAYALQLYFDFSGYSDIAIGLGMLLGIHLPENFNHPYLKPDLSKFWNSWHITLTQWIRSYVFNPFVRSLRSKKEHALPQWLILLITQLTTMLLIGLWHGVSLNFLIWGAWHGLGLFAHQLFNRLSAGPLRQWETSHPTRRKLYTLGSTLLTFLYVCLGWIWFVLPDPASSLAFFGKLFT